MNQSPSKNEIAFVRESLLHFNTSCVGHDGHTSLNFVEYDSQGISLPDFLAEPTGGGCT